MVKTRLIEECGGWTVMVTTTAEYQQTTLTRLSNGGWPSPPHADWKQNRSNSQINRLKSCCIRDKSKLNNVLKKIRILFILPTPTLSQVRWELRNECGLMTLASIISSVDCLSNFCWIKLNCVLWKTFWMLNISF